MDVFSACYYQLIYIANKSLILITDMRKLTLWRSLEVALVTNHKESVGMFWFKKKKKKPHCIVIKIF